MWSCRHMVKSRVDPVESLSIFALAMGYKGLNQQDNFGRSTLHYAAYRGATVCCMMLVQVSTKMDIDQI